MDPIVAGILLVVGITAALYIMDWLDGWLHRRRTRREKGRLRWK